MGRISCTVVLGLAVPAVAHGAPACPLVFDGGTLSLDWQPAFVHVDRYDAGEALTVSSFFNTAQGDNGAPTFFARDRVARIANFDPDTFDAADVEDLTDRTLPPQVPFGKTAWPNEAVRAPDGMFPFEAVVIPQGFFPAPFPGRLTAVDVATGTEYVIAQSLQQPGGPTSPLDPANSPRFYHRALFLDVDGDGLEDIVTVRSGFRVGPAVYPPFAELVAFMNPGASLAPASPWREIVLYGGPAAGFMGPDIHLAMHDFEGDGIPEIVATHFFSGGSSGGPPTGGRIAIYGAPVGKTWADVNALQFRLPRVATISSDQGFPFDVQIVDLDRDGRADVLATNHQPDNCGPPTSSAVPGRVYALSPPLDGNLFTSPWTTHILLDGIRPNPTLAGTQPPGRLAPGRAQVFWPMRIFQWFMKPWIVVGGDEAGKVWMLEPHSQAPGTWDYDAAVVLDVNERYGAGTSQTPLPGIGRAINTVSGIAIRYDGFGPFGFAQLFVPIFEARDIAILSMRPSPGSSVRCIADARPACP